MANKRFLGKIYEGRWRVEKFDKSTRNYTLKNIYNDREMIVCTNMLRRIDRGESSISGLIVKRGKLEGLNIYSW